jgi:hypothetical protein
MKMHSKGVILGLGLLITLGILGILGLAGCSDDSNPPTNSGITAGSPTNPDYLLVQNQLNTYLDSTQQFFTAGLGNIYQLPADTGKIPNAYGPVGPQDTASYVYYDGWHITYVSRDNDNFVNRLLDSVQFMNNSKAIQNPAGLDYLHYIHHWEFGAKNSVATHTSMNGDVNLEFSDLDTDVAHINGTKNLVVEWNYFSIDSTVTAMFDMNVVATDIAIQQIPNYGWSSGCPSSGNVNIDLNVSYSLDTGFGPDLSVKTWSCKIAYENGTATVNMVSDNKFWSYTREICTPVQ